MFTLTFKKVGLNIFLASLAIVSVAFLTYAAASAEAVEFRDSSVIQEAIDIAYAGDIVWIEPATYIFSSDLIIPKDITLISDEPFNTIFNLGDYCILIKKSRDSLSAGKLRERLQDVTIDGITITGHSGISINGPIQNHAKELTLRNSRIINNKGVKVSAIYSSRRTTLNLENCVIAGNRSMPADGVSQYGLNLGNRCYSGTIYLGICTKLYVKNSTIANNISEAGHFIDDGGNEIEVTYGAILQTFFNYVNITDSIMRDNGDIEDFAHVIKLGLRGDVYNSCFEKKDDAGEEDVPVRRDFQYIIYDDPRFINPAKMNYNVGADSLCKKRNIGAEFAFLASDGEPSGEPAGAGGEDAPDANSGTGRANDESEGIKFKGCRLTVINGYGSGDYGFEEVVGIRAYGAEGGEFTRWTGDVENVTDLNSPSTTVTLPGLADVESASAEVPSSAEQRIPVTITAEYASGGNDAYSPIFIIGDEPYVSQVRRALILLKDEAPDAYAVVHQYIGKIERAKSSGMAAYASPPTFFYQAEEAHKSVTWCAGQIAHDSYHSKLYHEYLAENGAPVPDYVWGGQNIEILCIQYQIEVMKQIGAPRSEIDYLKFSTGTHRGVIINSYPNKEAPFAHAQLVFIDENFPLTRITLHADAGAGDKLSYEIVKRPSRGALSEDTSQEPLNTPANDYTVVYTPDAGYTGEDSFTFKANDGRYDSNIATVYIVIEAGEGNSGFTLTLSSTEGGSTSPREGRYTYRQLEEIDIEAIADHGYKFKEWTGINVPYGLKLANPLENVKMDRNRILQAHFEPASSADVSVSSVNPYIISAYAGGGGKIDPAGYIKADEGEIIDFKITPEVNNGYYISEVMVNRSPVPVLSPYGFIHTVEVEGDMEIIAAFKRIAYTLNILPAEGGSTSPPQGKYSYGGGEVAEIKAIAYSGYRFTGWSGDVPSTRNPLQIRIMRDLQVTANFKREPHIITTKIGEGAQTGYGGIIVPGGKVEVEHGNSQQFLIKPWEGYHIKEVLIDGIPIRVSYYDSYNGKIYTFTNVISGHTVQAIFAGNGGR